MKTILIFCVLTISTCFAAELVATDKNPSITNEPNTTTIRPFTTTEQPPAPPVPDLLNFNLTDENHTICALFQFEAVVRIYLNSTEKREVILQQTTTVDKNKSDCKNTLAYIFLNINGNEKENLYLQLEHNGSVYSLSQIVYNNESSLYETNKTSIVVDENKSFLCQSKQGFELSNNSADKAVLVLKNLKIDAFRKNNNSTEFRSEIQECEIDYPQNDLVPLVVGFALIVLVFIVLIAYVVGRKRSRRLTYQSV